MGQTRSLAQRGLIVAAALLAATAALGQPRAGADVALDQGWNAKAVGDWVSANQGSRLLPLAWFKALEQPDARGLFLDPGYMAKFRYLPGPDGLPLGFTIDGQNDSLFVDTQRRWTDTQ